MAPIKTLDQIKEIANLYQGKKSHKYLTNIQGVSKFFKMYDTSM